MAPSLRIRHAQQARARHQGGTAVERDRDGRAADDRIERVRLQRREGLARETQLPGCLLLHDSVLSCSRTRKDRVILPPTSSTSRLRANAKWSTRLRRASCARILDETKRVPRSA